MGRAGVILDLFKRGRVFSYGRARSQRADLHLPSGLGPHPLVVLIHGGSWTDRYGRIVMRGLVGDLLRRRFAVWNIEYRRVGGGGGWPATFADVAAAIDYLPRVDAPLMLDGVTVIGHSAGGHLALWAAARPRLPDGAPGRILGEPRMRIARVIAQAGVCDLAGAYRLWRGGAVLGLMGGPPEELPERYAAGDPISLLPLSMPALLVHGTSDETVSIELARSYERAARAAGSEIELVEIPGAAGRHRAHIDPRGRAWAAVTGHLSAPACGSSVPHAP
ncbi:MAG: alpha/beta hydrolase family protein [Solirubrobacteraceae bacterium]